MNETWSRVPVWEDVHSRRILRDTVHLIMWSEVVFLATSVGSFPSYQILRTRGRMGQQSKWILARVIWYCPTDSYQKIFGSFLTDVVDILLRIPVWYVAHQPSAWIWCQPVSFEKIRKILVVPVCHRHTPAIGYFSKARLLAIIGSPWPMTAI
jgi:hypothetical protein